MKVLFIHPNCPGQYKHIARIMAEDPKNQVVFISKQNTSHIPNITKVEYVVGREPSYETHRYIIGFERAIFQGQEIWRVCNKLKQSGFIPDVICAHPGWGDALFLKDIYPDTPLLNFLEFYYRAFGADVYFDPSEEVDPDELTRIRVKNANNLFNLEACDWGITPTNWQKEVQPKEFQYKISVLHDGIDTTIAAPGDIKTLALPDGTTLQKGQEIVTYVSRNFEPYRGFPIVMRGIEKIIKDRPNAHVLVVGDDGVSYGRNPEGGKTYREQVMEELDLDLSRIHFMPKLPYNDFLKVLQYSRAHIYYTVPFVLSWSMLEAMSVGCAIVGSATKPVEEVIEDGVNGLLADFFSPDDLARRVSEILDHPTQMQHIRDAARQTIIDKYALDKVIPLHIQLITELAGGGTPSKTAQEIEQFNEKVILAA